MWLLLKAHPFFFFYFGREIVRDSLILGKAPILQIVVPAGRDILKYKSFFFLVLTSEDCAYFKRI